VANRQCCSRPCLTTTWVKVRGRDTFGHVCTNCVRFTPSDGGKRVQLHRLPGKSGVRSDG
jgi:hypothetical protein